MLPSIRKLSIALFALTVVTFAYVIAPIAFGRVPSVSAASLDQTTPHNLQLIDRLGGTTTNVAVNGQYAYIIVSDRLIVLDISNPATPLKLGSLALSYSIRKMVAVNDLLYMAGGDAGLHIISVSDPLYPVEVGSFSPGEQFEFAAQGHFIYTTTHDGSNESLHIVDVAKPSSPLEVGNYTYSGEIVRLAPYVAVQGDYAYVLGVWLSELRVVDISDPTNPREVSSIPMPTSSVGTLARTSLTITGQTAYASYTDDMPDFHSRFDGLALVDISHPLAPKLQGQIVSSRNVFPQGNIAASDNYLYWGRSDKIEVINIADHENPIVEKSLDISSTSFVVADNRLYNISPDQGLQIFDTSTLLAPLLVGSYNNGLIYRTVNALGIQNNLLYTYGGDGMQVLDLSTPTKSVLSSLPVHPSQLPVMIYKNLLTLDGNMAYLIWREPGDPECYGFHVVDISDPLALSANLTYQLGCTTINDHETPIYILAINNRYLYATNSGGKLHIYDLTTPATPTLLGTYEPMMELGPLLLNGNFAFLAGWGANIEVLDVSNPMIPTHIGSYSAVERVAQFAVKGHYLVVASVDQAAARGSLYILDISNPAAPFEIGHAVLPPVWISYMVIQGDYVYLSDDYGGLRVFDIVELTQPREVAFYSGLFYPGLEASQVVPGAENKLYAAFGANGLLILQLSGSISGKVSDSFGKPHVGVKVTLNNGQSTQTNAQGDYSFNSLTPGSYTVKVESSTYDFQPSERTLRAPSYASDAINFTLLLKPLSTVVTPDAPTHLSYTDLVGNLLAFDMPVGMVVQPTTLKVLPQAFAAAPGQFFTGVRFDLQMGEVNSASSNFTFTAPLTISIHYTDSAVAPVTDREQLMLRWWNGSQWMDATTTCEAATPALHDLVSQALTTTVCQSGQFALFGPTVQYFLPLVSRSQVETSEMRGRFVAQHSGKCLNVLAESQQNGASIIQWPCEDGDNEIWSLHSQGEYVQIVAKHSQKCLNVSNASQAEGAQVIQHSCSGGDNELWRLLPVGDNLYQIVAKHSNQCLTVQDASQEDKAQVIQSICSESPNQIWRFQAAN